ncbi:MULTISPECIES: hypothetical protein [unclassified Rathayibacter]|uniref:hypothetical protein n=1 Tax=unclassified Rathayibacter TaxID=2609250 RepID=UPI0006FE7940|nr:MULTISPECIES: hypothetical protein [unclassified Rathayibacter]KQQ05573.1 hypothetical protein ASF42_03115 [Rathayibacter sp. Leaf294]KQS13435.1 hypothetical protein ASG06_03130 [Rathayibacter sp. Leaf185]
MIGPITAAIVLPLLVGCAEQNSTTYSDYDKVQEERDVLPFLGRVAENLDPESVDFAGSVDGLDFYRADGRDTAGRCIIVHSDDGLVSGCGDTVSKQNEWTVRIHPDDAAPEDATGDGWTQLGENLSVHVG